MAQQPSITWPDSFPPVLLAGNTVTSQNSYISTPMDSGRPIVRNVLRVNDEIQEVTFVMNASTGCDFESFWLYELNNGGEWFNMTISDPFGTSSRIVRFEPQTYTRNPLGGGLFEYTSTLRIIKQLPTENEYEVRINPSLIGDFDSRDFDPRDFWTELN